MITDLILEYFEIYKYAHFKFHPRVNSIIGSSDQGKSSVRKAINLVRTNRPTGTNYKHKKYPNKTTKVTIKTKQHTVVRVRGKRRTENYYLLDGRKLDALNKQVPEEIQKALNLPDINVQNQFDPFFLLQDSPGAVAKQFNSFVGLELIDTVAANANKAVRAINQKVKNIKKEKKEITQQIKQYAHLEIITPLLNKANKLSEIVQKNNEKIDKIKKLLSTRKILQNELDTLPDFKNIKNLLQQAKNLQKHIETIQNQYKQISHLFSQKKQLQTELSTYGNLSEIKTLLNKAAHIHKTLKSRIRETNKIHDVLYSHKKISAKYSKSRAKLNNIKKKLKKITQNITDCPLCGSEWKKKYEYTI